MNITEYRELQKEQSGESCGRESIPTPISFGPNVNGLSLSGGGIRSCLFHVGVLQNMALLGKFDMIAGVSIGGVIAGLYSGAAGFFGQLIDLFDIESFHLDCNDNLIPRQQLNALAALQDSVSAKRAGSILARCGYVQYRPSTDAVDAACPSRTSEGIQREQREQLSALSVLSRAHAAVQIMEIRDVIAADGTIYPFRFAVDIAKRFVGSAVRYYFQQSGALDVVVGEHEDEAVAFEKFVAQFHKLVNTHWRKPSHLHTDEDERVNRILDHLVDWERYRVLNPIEQPLWGKLLEIRANGDAFVEWLSGPGDTRDETSVLKSKDVCLELLEIPVGEWFYGSGKVYPEKLQWIEPPTRVPDPYDKEAVAAAWNSIPVHVMSDPDAWPLKKQD